MGQTALLWATVVTILSTACTSGSDPSPLSEEFTSFAPDTSPSSTVAAPPPTISSSTPPAAATTASPADGRDAGRGRLVILDANGNVAVTSPDGSKVEVITDAFAEGAAFFQPLWAPGGEHLAWAEASPAGFGLVTARPDGSGRANAGMPSPPFYFYWSPDGSRIAALHNGVNGVEMKLVEAGGTVGTFAGSGTPFYISWSPTTDDLIAHIGLDRLTAIGPAGTSTDVGLTGGGYQAPQWLDGGVVHLSDGKLLLVDGNGDSATLANLSGNAGFVANQQGTRLAIQTFAEDEPAISVALQTVPDIRPNIVSIIDLRTREAVTASVERSIGFFWSPDGEKLLMFHATDDPGHIDLSVWDSSGTRQLLRYRPQFSFVRDVLPFFNQYAQSLQLWAPDSAGFALAGTIDDKEGIWVQPIDGSAPTFVTDGTWVAWSDR